jgi:SAM-dependent methyltransferase
MCNSVLHHLAEPHRLLSEVARLVKPHRAILIRDLRRPSRLAHPLHVRWYGRHYSGLMYQLYRASVRATPCPNLQSYCSNPGSKALASSLTNEPTPPSSARSARGYCIGRT